MRITLKLIKWLVVLALVYAVAFLLYAAVKINRPFKTAAEEQLFEIAAGSTTKKIGGELERHNLISSALIFRIYLQLRNESEIIQAGTYRLSASMPVSEIAAALTSGRVVSDEVRLTVIEGWDLRDIASVAAKLGVVSENEFYRVSGRPLDKNSLEGYLFPDTYFIAKDAKAEEIVKKIQTNFERKVDAALREEIKNQSRTLADVITLASIVEREVGRPVKKGTILSAEELSNLSVERRIVAGIFLNRLAARMPLESDATVGYITGSSSNRATIEETKINSPYNTYRYPGLPPGPIANPSLDSIKAAVNPTKTDYLFFLTSPDGTAHFAKTLQEHNANRAKYLE